MITRGTLKVKAAQIDLMNYVPTTIIDGGLIDSYDSF